MNVKCMNAIRLQDQWVYCGWQGEVDNINDPCPQCCRSNVLAPLIYTKSLKERIAEIETNYSVSLLRQDAIIDGLQMDRNRLRNALTGLMDQCRTIESIVYGPEYKEAIDTLLNTGSE